MQAKARFDGREASRIITEGDHYLTAYGVLYAREQWGLALSGAPSDTPESRAAKLRMANYPADPKDTVARHDARLCVLTGIWYLKNGSQTLKWDSHKSLAEARGKWAQAVQIAPDSPESRDATRLLSDHVTK